MPKLKDISGERFGKLIILDMLHIKRGKWRSGSSFSHVYWNAICDCGNRTIVNKNSMKKSCGCLNKERENSRVDDTLRVLKMKFLAYKARSKKKNLSFEITFAKFLELSKEQCYYCGSPPNKIKCDWVGNVLSNNRRQVFDVFANGVDRKDNTKGYTVSNSVPACRRCNQMKNDMSIDEFFLMINKIYNKRVK